MPASELSLDRDCARWNVDPKMVERRRFFFWELCTLDCWHVRPRFVYFWSPERRSSAIRPGLLMNELSLLRADLLLTEPCERKTSVVCVAIL